MPMMLLVTVSSAARSRVADGGGGGGGAEPHEDKTTAAAKARKGGWKRDMSTPGQDMRSLQPRTAHHKTKICQCVVRRSSSLKSRPRIPRAASTCLPRSLNVADRPSASARTVEFSNSG